MAGHTRRSVLKQAGLAALAVGAGEALISRDASAAAPAGERLVLWYEEPAKHAMTEALPVGNGRLGGVVFGEVHRERLQFNENSLWTGDENPGGVYETLGAYQAFGDLYLTFDGEPKPAGSYRRELDLAAGVARTEFTREGVRHRREAFASHPAQVIALRWSADRRGALSGLVELR